MRETWKRFEPIIAFLFLVLCSATAEAQAPSPTSGARHRSTSNAYPTKPVRVIISTSPSGGTDFAARIFGQKLTELWGQSVVMDNRPGATGLIGMDVVAHATPDGYTLLVMNVGHLITAALTEKLNFDVMKDLTPVSVIAKTPVIFVVHPSVGARTVQEFVALAKSKPGDVRYASAGSGSSPHLSAEMFRHMTGVDIVHVPYKGSTPGVTATITGETGMMFTGVASAIAHIKAGRLRALSVNGAKRSPALPEVPTAKESGLPGFEVDFWIGIFVPTGTPHPVITRLNGEVNRIINVPEIKERFLAIGADPAGGTPEQFAAIVRKDIERWARTVKASGMRVE